MLEATRSYDAVGRVIEDVSNASGSNYQRRINTYNSNGWLTQQETRNGSNVAQSRVNYTQFDQVGNVLNYQMAVLTGYQYTNYYRYQYLKQDGYKEQVIYGTSSYFQAGNTTSTYDVNGNLVSVADQFNANKTRSFVNDQAGHILNKTENGLTQYYFYVNDKANGSTGANGNADFDFNYTPVSDQYPATTPTGYVVSQGDTLRSIALAVYGDAQLWYLIADANGLKTDAELVAGKNLKIPNQITNLRNDFSTFKPYSPGEIIGDTMPTLPDPPPPPQKGGGCGVVGQIIMIIIVIVATILTAGAMAGPGAGAAGAAGAAGTAATGTVAAGTAATGVGATMSAGVSALGAGITGAGISAGAGTLGMAGYAVAGAVGSIAGQAFGMATGMQDSFSWKQVAMGAISSVAGGAAASIPGLGGAGNLSTGQLVGRAVVGNIIGQGVSVAVGLQDKFSWKNVAASAVGAAVGSAVKGELGNAFNDAFGEFGGRVARGTISGFAAGAAASIMSGGRMNVTQIATDAFGNALGNSIAEANWGGSQQTEKVATAAEKTSAANTDAPLTIAQRRAMEAGFGPLTPEAAAEVILGPENLDGTQLAAGKGYEPGGYGKDRVAPVRTFNDLIFEADKSQKYADRLNELAKKAAMEGSPYAETYRAAAEAHALKAREYSADASAMTSSEISVTPRGMTFDPTAPRPASAVVYGRSYGISVVNRPGPGVSAWGVGYDMTDASTNDYLAAKDYNSERTLNIVSLPFAMLSTGLRVMNGLFALWSASRVARPLSSVGSAPVVLDLAGANTEAAFSRIVPGGGLQAHENAGGHLLLKHVGQSEQALMTRLANEPKISGSSSFYDRATAESAVSKVLDTNQVKIADWLNGSSSRLRLDSSLSNPVGISVSRGATGAVDVGSARLILVRDPSMPTGYKILTGFPTKP